MKKTLLTSFVFLLSCNTVHAFTKAEIASAKQFFRYFDNTTYVAPNGYTDQHLELVSINEDTLEATFTQSNIIAVETYQAHGKTCGANGYRYNLYGGNGSSTTQLCNRHGSCFPTWAEVKNDPTLVLIADGRILASYDERLMKLWRSRSGTFWTCSR